ncbi:trinucleotide repeat-containing gene 6C protein-like isoform X2 [Corythoichthys intestinalis]|uniref:trinucleotide repeat-containing gene 6C protein-like isoform X2 n=1 Tax=Corythoichthys intestinalis TaxID=161448 RepID=UPI0025A5A057|nr:trinucleotide repeat-containing gene 6C protein-like isoform X2 [Corythoichthys intestinalis]
MEDKKKKRQEEKKKKEAASKKDTEQITKVPDSANFDSVPSHPPANPSVTPTVPPSSGDGKRAHCGVQPQTTLQTPLQPRHPAREVPPRFRQQEHKQLLKRGQPLPPGTLTLTSTGYPTTPEAAVASNLDSSSTNLPSELPPQSSQGAQYDNPRWGHLQVERSATSAATSTSCSDQLIIDQKDTEAWPSITLSQNKAPEGRCSSETDPGHLTSSSSTCSTSSNSSSTSNNSDWCCRTSMATGANGQTGHFPVNHLSSKANTGLSPANHTGTNMHSSQVAANRSWGSGSGPSLSSVSSEGKNDSPAGMGSSRGWGSSSSSNTNCNLNLNPNANPSAWPVLGHDAGAAGVGSSGGGNVISPPQSTSNFCNPTGPQTSQTSTYTGANTNSNSSGIGSAWGSIMTSDASEPHPSASTNVSFSSEPQNLKTDGPNHINKQEQPSPIHHLPSWGNAPVGLGTVNQPASGAKQVNGEDNTSVWGIGSDPKAQSPKELSGWDSGWSQSGNGSGNSGGWGEQSSGDWSKKQNEDAQGGWDGPSSPPQDPQNSSWKRAVSTTAASEGSSDSMEGHPRSKHHSSREPPAPLLPAQDLDPRVLCNTGWGQTPVRQHTSWDMDNTKTKNDIATESWDSQTGPCDAQGPSNTNTGPPQRTDTGSKNEVPASQGASGWGGNLAASNQPSSGWGDQSNNIKPPSGPGGWGNLPKGGPTSSIPKNSGQSWGEEKSAGWEDSHGKPTTQNWGEQPKPPHSWGNSGGSNSANDWGEPEDRKKNLPNAAWEGETGGWKETPRGWGMPSSGQGMSGTAGKAGWGEPVSPRPSGPPQGWVGKSQDGPGSSIGGGMGSWSGPGSVKQGWTGSKQESSAEPTGWEEPSPPSIRRKMEIDDGTSAWGDPGTYNKSVNLWDRNNPGMSQAKATAGGNNLIGPNSSHPHSHNHAYQGPPAPLQNHVQNSPNPGPTSGSVDPILQHHSGSSHNRGPLIAQGWGELPSSQSKPESSWGEATPSAVNVDNGTSAWGKPTGGPTGWGDGNADNYSRGNPAMTSASCKPAAKPMQDGWGGGGDELILSGGQWDAEEGDMWNSTASQESNSSTNSWGNAPKKIQQKVKVPGKPEDTWIMNRLIKQLTDMGFPRDPAEEALKSNNMNLDQAMSALLEKKTELDKRGMGMAGHDYNGLINKTMGCPRPPLLSKEPSTDPRSPFMDKQMQSGMFGGGAAQARAMAQPPPQPPVPPLGSSQPSLRAQVPQFLSPQVQAQLLQFAAKNIGLNPALLTSPINPQHMTLLNQLYQLQLAYQRLQIQQQMLQAQRNVSGPIRQQEQQVARTINNMQQQIQQHQRQLAQALLMKQQQQQQQQQQQPPHSHTGLHHGGTKSNLDSFPGHPQAPGLPDLQTKEPQSSQNTYSPYSLSGLNPNMNVNCMEVGMSMKDPPQPQSRLSQWTHPNAMESLSGGSSPLEPNMSKHGTNLGPPGKPPQLDDSYSPYNLMSSSESPTSPLVPPDSWGQAKGSSDKLANGTNINWPPEFCPGVPWKGLQNIDPETDPNMTPGSVPSGPTINTNIQDVNRYLLRDRSAGKLSEMKSTWSPGPISHSQASLSHDMWKVPQGPRSSSTAPSRPPPGLTNTKPSSTWGGNSLGLSQGWSSSYTTAGTTWSTDSSSRTSSWLVLRNLTPQIDGSTLRTLCMQHGPLITFHLNLTQGNAVVRYSSKDEAAKAQKSLHMCVLGNTTILAEFAGEEEVNRFFAQGQSLGGMTSWQATPGANQTRMGGSGSATSHPMGHAPHWNNNNNGSGGSGGGKSGGEMLWGGVQQYSSLWGPPSGEEARVMGSPSPINTLLPGDLLSGESM